MNVQDLIDSLNKEKISGFSPAEIKLFSTLTDNDLSTLVKHHGQGTNQTIYHRIVSTNHAMIEKTFLVKCDRAFSMMDFEPSAKTKEELTNLLLHNKNLPFAKLLVELARSKGKGSYVSCRVTVATYLDSPLRSERAQQCIEIGIAIPSKEDSQKLSKKRLAAQPAPAPTVAEQELVLEKNKLAVAQEELQLFMKKFELQQKSRSVIVHERDVLKAQQAQHVQSLASMQTKLQQKEMEFNALATNSSSELQVFRDENRALSSALEKSHAKISEMEAELNGLARETAELQRRNQELTGDLSQYRKENQTLQTRLQRIPEALSLFQFGINELRVANGDDVELPADDIERAASAPAPASGRSHGLFGGASRRRVSGSSGEPASKRRKDDDVFDPKNPSL